MAESVLPGSLHQPIKIFLAAGEVSGDRQAAYLAEALWKHDPSLHLFGSGGERMRQAGVDLRLTTSHFGSVGFQESLRYLRPLRSVLSELRVMLLDERPDMAVLVDNEGFNGILARFLHKHDIPFAYYFPPQVWFWGEWRARAIARRAQLIIPAFEPELTIYRREGGNVEWFGHPLLDIVRHRIRPEIAFARRHLDPSRPTIALMPGSRFQELEQLTLPMLKAARIIRRDHPNLQIIMPVAAAHLRAMIDSRLRAAGMESEVTVVSEDVYECLSLCGCVLLSSGTATLEVALLGVPMVACYRVTPLTFFLGRQLVKSRFIAMPNILLNEPIVPELLQEEVTAERLAKEALAILGNPALADTMRRNLRRIRPHLGSEGVLRRVADAVYRAALAAREHVASEAV